MAAHLNTEADEPSADSSWMTGRRSSIDGHWRHRVHSDEPPPEILRRRAEARRALEDRRIERELGLRD